MVVGMIPLLRKKVAMRAGRGENGPDGCPARKTRLLHQCYAKLLEGWNALTADVKVLQWADGLWRRSWIVLAGLLSDQPEADTFCCDGSQSCKVCTRLHLSEVAAPRAGRVPPEERGTSAPPGVQGGRRHDDDTWTGKGSQTV